MGHRLAAAFAVGVMALGCAHTSPEEMSAEEHRGETLKHLQAAADEEARYDPKAVEMSVPTRTPFHHPTEPTIHTYNVTEHHLRAAEQHLAAAAEHREAAKTLERWEDEACVDAPPAERAACPLITGSVQRVEEISAGVRLVLREEVNAPRLAALMQCHLAFARTRGFQSPSCPLYVRGADVWLARGPGAIEVRGKTPEVAAEIRRQARALFAPEPVAMGPAAACW